MTAPVSTFHRHHSTTQYPTQAKRFGGSTGRPQHHQQQQAMTGAHRQQLITPMQDVAQWLKGLRLHKYTEMLQAMSYDEMLSLDEECLLQRGVTTGARRKLVQCVNKLKERVPVLRSFVDAKGELLLDVNVVIDELRKMLATPMKPYDCGYQQQGFGAAMTDLDEKNLPGHIICVLERIYERRSRQRKNVESLVALLDVYDRINKHHAFTESQRKRVVGWRNAVVTMINQQQPDLLATRKRVSKDGALRKGYRNPRPHDSSQRSQKTLKVQRPEFGSSGDPLLDAQKNYQYWSRMQRSLEEQGPHCFHSTEEFLDLRQTIAMELKIAISQLEYYIEARQLEERRRNAQRPHDPFQQLFQSPTPYRRWSNGSGQDNNDVNCGRIQHNKPMFSVAPVTPISPPPCHYDVFRSYTQSQNLSFNDWNNVLSSIPPVRSPGSSTSSGSFPSLSDRSCAGSPPQALSPPVTSTHSPSPSMSSNESDENTDIIVYDFQEHTLEKCDLSKGLRYFRPEPEPELPSTLAPIGTGRKMKPRQESLFWGTAVAN